MLARIGLRGAREGAQLLDGPVPVEQRLEQGQTGRIAEGAEPLSDDLERLPGQRRFRGAAGHAQRSGGAGAAHAEPPPAAHTAPPSEGIASGRFQGSLNRTCASPQVPVAPANVSPAPKKAAMPRNHGFTRVPRAMPVKIIEPAIS